MFALGSLLICVFCEDYDEALDISAVKSLMLLVLLPPGTAAGVEASLTDEEEISLTYSEDETSDSLQLGIAALFVFDCARFALHILILR